jgi:hypothetical protein
VVIDFGIKYELKLRFEDIAGALALLTLPDQE